MQQLKSRPALLAMVFALILGAVIGGTAVAATQVHMRNALSELGIGHAVDSFFRGRHSRATLHDTETPHRA